MAINRPSTNGLYDDCIGTRPELEAESNAGPKAQPTEAIVEGKLQGRARTHLSPTCQGPGWLLGSERRREQ